MPEKSEWRCMVATRETGIRHDGGTWIRLAGALRWDLRFRHPTKQPSVAPCDRRLDGAPEAALAKDPHRASVVSEVVVSASPSRWRWNGRMRLSTWRVTEATYCKDLPSRQMANDLDIEQVCMARSRWIGRMKDVPTATNPAVWSHRHHDLQSIVPNPCASRPYQAARGSSTTAKVSRATFNGTNQRARGGETTQSGNYKNG